MKGLAARLFFSGLLAIAAAATIDVDALHHGKDCILLQLWVVAPPASRLGGPIFVLSNDIVGIPAPTVRNAHRARPAFFYPVPSSGAAGTAATANTSGVAAVLHLWSDSVFDPANDHLLAVPTGSGGCGGGALAPLAIAVVPANATNTTAGTGLDWQSFVLSDGLAGRNSHSHRRHEARSPWTTEAADHKEGHRAAPRPRAPPPLRLNSLTYAGQQGRWVAVQRTQDVFAVAWYDGVSPIIDTYIPIDVVYQELRCK